MYYRKLLITEERSEYKINAQPHIQIEEEEMNIGIEEKKCGRSGNFRNNRAEQSRWTGGYMC